MIAKTHAEPRRRAKMSVKEFGKTFFKECRDDDVPGIAAEVAYHLTFAIPPLLTLIVMVAAALNRFSSLPVEETLRGFVAKRAPANIQDVLETAIEHAVAQVSGDLVSIGLLTTTLIAVWAGSNGVGALMKAFNRAYDVTEGRPIVRKKIVAIGLTLLMAVLANTAIGLLVFGPQIGRWLADWVGLGQQFETIWGLSRIPVAIVLLIVLLAVLYRLAPNIEQSMHWLSPGAVIATILWIGLLFAFRLYLRVANPGSAYGAFGSLVVFLLFLYLTAIVLLVGAEINAILQKRFDDEVVRYRAEHPERLDSDRARDEAQELAAESDARDPGADHGPDDTPYSRRPLLQPALLGTAGILAGTLIGWLAGRQRRS